jgi:hypothetical protein
LVWEESVASSSASTLPVSSMTSVNEVGSRIRVSTRVVGWVEEAWTLASET